MTNYIRDYLFKEEIHKVQKIICELHNSECKRKANKWHNRMFNRYQQWEIRHPKTVSIFEVYSYLKRQYTWYNYGMDENNEIYQIIYT